MSAIFALAQLTASDYQFISDVNNELLYTAVNRYIELRKEEAMQSEGVFIARQTEKGQMRYQLPGGGRMSRRALGTRGPVVRATGNWNVAFPLEDFGERIANDDVQLAYMTPAELQRHVDTIWGRYLNQRRHQILHRLLDNQASAAVTFTDERLGDLSVYGLANGEAGVLYPPVLGDDTEATEDHYLESNYAATAITDTNNPYVTNVEDLIHHFGDTTGGDAVVTFINQAEEPETNDLTDFVPVEDSFIRSGSNTDVPFNLPNVPGKIIGRTNGTWVSVWRWMPANYMLSIHLEEEAPLMERVDPAATGLPQGLTLVAQDEGTYAMRSWDWRGRFGLGAGNRLNGVVMELGTGGTYTVPTAYDSP